MRNAALVVLAVAAAGGCRRAEITDVGPDGRAPDDAPDSATVADSASASVGDAAWPATSHVTPRSPTAVDVADPAACRTPPLASGACSGVTSAEAGSLIATANFPLATQLPDGRVLLVSGTRAQLYDPACDRWTIAASLTSHRSRFNWHGSRLFSLDDGRAIVLGTSRPPQTLEVYDPAADKWSAPISVPGMAYVDGAVLLDGTTIVVAGESSETSPVVTHAAFDAKTGTWRMLPSPAASAGAASEPIALFATSAGRVHEIWSEGSSRYRAADWDPATSTWTERAAPPAELVAYPDFVLQLADGKVALIAATSWPTSIYDPKGDTYAGAYSGMPLFGTATMLSCGKILLLGGATDRLWDPIADPKGEFALTFANPRPREAHTAIMLRDGRLLIAGGGEYYAGPGFQVTEVR